MSQPISSRCNQRKSCKESLVLDNEDKVFILYWNKVNHPLLQPLQKVLKRQMPTLTMN